MRRGHGTGRQVHMRDGKDRLWQRHPGLQTAGVTILRHAFRGLVPTDRREIDPQGFQNLQLCTFG